MAGFIKFIGDDCGGATNGFGAGIGCGVGGVGKDANGFGGIAVEP